jgi:hypothetical protein
MGSQRSGFYYKILAYQNLQPQRQTLFRLLETFKILELNIASSCGKK